MLAGDSNTEENCRTFVFKGETHTLGNALKNVILQNPQVVFCGYSMPHPSEDQVNENGTTQKVPIQNPNTKSPNTKIPTVQKSPQYKNPHSTKSPLYKNRHGIKSPQVKNPQNNVVFNVEVTNLGNKYC